MAKINYKTKRYNRRIKKGAGFFSNTAEYVSNKTKKALDSIKSTSSNLVSSVKDISKSKYLFSLLVNPGSVHRMLFKNAYFIDFIEPSHIKRLYCQGQPDDCVVIEKGYIYSNNAAVVNAANDAEAESQLANTIVNSAQTEMKENANTQTLPIDNNQLYQIAKEIEKNEKNLEEESSNTGFINQTMNRLAFAKLNDALLTDDFEKAEKDKNYITFKPGYQPLFELLTTYKHQYNRTIHYGGWDEWVYLNKKITEFISLKSELQKEFMGMIWGTTGMIKLIKIALDKGGTITNSFKEASKKGSEYLKQFISGLNKEQSEAASKKNKQDEFEMENKIQKEGWKFPKINMSLSSPKINIPKYRVIRILIKYYDIDPGKYNFNILKRYAILKKNYPLFMEREAKKAVQIAINNLKANSNNSILTEEKINKFVDEQSITDKTLDDLLNELMKYNTTSNTQQRGGNKTERKKHSSKIKRRTLKSNNMHGGLPFDSPFFNNVKMIFKMTYKMMIDTQMVALSQFIIGKPEEHLDPNKNKNTKLIAELYAQITRCISMASMNLCFTISSTIISHLSYGLAAMPACVLSNVMYAVFLYETRILDYDKMSIYEQSGTKTAINDTGNTIINTGTSIKNTATSIATSLFTSNPSDSNKN